jgi:hypothetical protein
LRKHEFRRIRIRVSNCLEAESIHHITGSAARGNPKKWRGFPEIFKTLHLRLMKVVR